MNSKTMIWCKVERYETRKARQDNVARAWASGARSGTRSWRSPGRRKSRTRSATATKGGGPTAARAKTREEKSEELTHDFESAEEVATAREEVRDAPAIEERAANRAESKWRAHFAASADAKAQNEAELKHDGEPTRMRTLRPLWEQEDPCYET